MLFFENMIKRVIEELKINYLTLGSKYMIVSLKLQINSLKLVMNKAFLIFMNVALYKEVISKFISPSVLQYVLVAVARAGMVHSNKY